MTHVAPPSRLRVRRAAPLTRPSLLLLGLLCSGCISRCDPAVVPMPPGLDDIDFNVTPRDLDRRGAHDLGQRLMRWPNGAPVAYTEKAERFRSYYEACPDVSLCDEVTYSLEDAQGKDHSLTLVRLGGPLLSVAGRSPKGRITRAPATRDRCDHYRALARDLWGEPSQHHLDGRLEVFEISSRIWGAALCMEGSGGELFIAQPPRIRELYEK
jgi:hypothetical protein